MLMSGLRHLWVSCGFDFYEKTPKSFGQRLRHFRYYMKKNVLKLHVAVLFLLKGFHSTTGDLTAANHRLVLTTTSFS